MVWGTRTAAAVGNAPITIRPLSPAASPARSRRAAESSAKTALARRATMTPAEVGTTPRDSRRNRLVPAAASIAATCLDTADCV